MNDDFPYVYEGLPLAKDEIYIKYRLKKYKNDTTKLTIEDYNIIINYIMS